jgi:hypothetical protein
MQPRKSKSYNQGSRAANPHGKHVDQSTKHLDEFFQAFRPIECERDGKTRAFYEV